ncbi:MAG: hypothetical protein ABIV10_15635 [Gemmatimonadaceae bacterium]
MSIRPEDVAKRVLRREWQQLSADERHVIESVLAKSGVAREATALGDERRTLGERLADRIAMEWRRTGRPHAIASTRRTTTA